jgi:hypothetical protein
MKKLQAIIMAIFIILAYCSSGYSQKMMKLDDELKNNSSPMEVKRKGMSSKFEFGPYRIVSFKAGWTTTTSNKKMFSSETNSESKTKYSFVFVANSKDTLHVNISSNIKSSETEFSDFLTSTNQSTNNYLIMISPDADTVIWKMIVVFEMGTEVKGKFNGEGLLTDEVNKIQIRQVKQFEDGKPSPFKTICGFEFFKDSGPLAAVQPGTNYSLKLLVWLHQSLDEKMKSILAPATASLIVCTDIADSAN